MPVAWKRRHGAGRVFWQFALAMSRRGVWRSEMKTIPRVQVCDRRRGSGALIAAIRNLILPGFNPDSSICRVGEDYYIANSTLRAVPGQEIHHSRDLVNRLHLSGTPERAS